MTELIQDIHKVSLENAPMMFLEKLIHLLKKGLPKNSEILLTFILLAKSKFFTAVELTYSSTMYLLWKALVCVMKIFVYHLLR